MLKSTKFFMTVVFLVILVLVGGLYITSKNAINQEPIKIYKTVTPIKQTEVSIVAPTLPDASEEETGITFSLDTSSEHVHEYAPQEQKSHWIDDTFADEPESETLTHNEHIDENFHLSKRIHDQIEIFAARIQHEYPELLEIQNMTLEEIAALSAEKRKRISVLSQQFLTEFDEIRNLYSQLPDGHLEDIISSLQRKYKEQWGSEITEQVLADIRSHLE